MTNPATGANTSSLLRYTNVQTLNAVAVNSGATVGTVSLNAPGTAGEVTIGTGNNKVIVQSGATVTINAATFGLGNNNTVSDSKLDASSVNSVINFVAGTIANNAATANNSIMVTLPFSSSAVASTLKTGAAGSYNFLPSGTGQITIVQASSGSGVAAISPCTYSRQTIHCHFRQIAGAVGTGAMYE